MSENALIINADLKFGDVGGKSGQQFQLDLTLEHNWGRVGVTFNPMKLPQLLKALELDKFSELKGTYVQMMDTPVGCECKGIRKILAKDTDEWFPTENSIYFGSEFFKGYDEID